MSERTITGRHVLFAFVAGFGTIIAVNMTLAVNAVATFPGLEVRNSYVASQAFDAKRAAQEALGWEVAADYDGAVLTLSITDRAGRAFRPDDLQAVVGRPTRREDDVVLALDEALSMPIHLGRGLWHVDVSAVAADGTAFERRLPLRVVR